MADYSEVFVGLDTSKLRNAVAIAEGGQSEIRGDPRQVPGLRFAPSGLRLLSQTRRIARA